MLTNFNIIQSTERSLNGGGSFHAESHAKIGNFK